MAPYLSKKCIEMVDLLSTKYGFDSKDALTYLEEQHKEKNI